MAQVVGGRRSWWRRSSIVVCCELFSASFHFFGSFAAFIHVSLFLRSLPLESSVSSTLMNSLRSSSHLFRSSDASGRLVLETRLGFHCAALFVHLFPCGDALLMARRHFRFRCVPIQHRILNVRIFSHASLVLLLMMKSIRSSSSSSVRLVLSLMSFSSEMLLSWS